MGACHWSRRTSPQPFAPRGKGRFARVRGARQSADWLRPRPLRAPALSASVRRLRGRTAPHVARARSGVPWASALAAAQRARPVLRAGGTTFGLPYGASLALAPTLPSEPAIGVARSRGAAGRAVREDWLGARAPPAADGAADARAGRRETTASRRIRPADASQAPDGEKRPCAGDRDERAGRESATNPRGSAAGFRKTRARPTRGRVDAAATGGRRQSADCRAPAAQGATRARARAATAGNRTRLSATRSVSTKLDRHRGVRVLSYPRWPICDLR